jgi:hypothetical protein
MAVALAESGLLGNWPKTAICEITSVKFESLARFRAGPSFIQSPSRGWSAPAIRVSAHRLAAWGPSRPGFVMLDVTHNEWYPNE